MSAVKILFLRMYNRFLFPLLFCQVHRPARMIYKYMWALQVLRLPLNYPSNGATAETRVSFIVGEIWRNELSLKIHAPLNKLLFCMEKNGPLFMSSLVWSMRPFYFLHAEAYVMPERWCPNNCTQVNGKTVVRNLT